MLIGYTIIGFTFFVCGVTTGWFWGYKDRTTRKRRTKTQYSVCIVFTRDSATKIRIETIMFYGSIKHKTKENPEKLFDKQKAVDDALKEEGSIKLLKDGFTFFLANHVVLTRG